MEVTTNPRTQIDALIEQQKYISRQLDNPSIKGFDLINARKRWHKLDKAITRLCKDSGERRVL